ncbi:hypothetical protein Tco_0252496 [Tanacetum coccineum]
MEPAVLPPAAGVLNAPPSGSLSRYKVSLGRDYYNLPPQNNPGEYEGLVREHLAQAIDRPHRQEILKSEGVEIGILERKGDFNENQLLVSGCENGKKFPRLQLFSAKLSKNPSFGYLGSRVEIGRNGHSAHIEVTAVSLMVDVLSSHLLPIGRRIELFFAVLVGLGRSNSPLLSLDESSDSHSHLPSSIDKRFLRSF